MIGPAPVQGGGAPRSSGNQLASGGAENARRSSGTGTGALPIGGGGAEPLWQGMPLQLNQGMNNHLFPNVNAGLHNMTSLFTAQQPHAVPMDMGEPMQQQQPLMGWPVGLGGTHPMAMMAGTLAGQGAGLEEPWRLGSVAGSLPFSGVPQPVMHGQQRGTQ